MGVDNCELNIKTAKFLNKMGKGFYITVARCLNHCLNLVFVAFLQPFETKFGLQKLLRSIRAYIKSGGGQSRRAQLCEHGLSLSGIDFTVTRWSSFLRAVLYVMGSQSKRELKAAREQLELMVKWDKSGSTAEALQAPDVSRPRWTELYGALEAMGEDAKKQKQRGERAVGTEGGEIKEVSLDTLLTSMVDIEVYAAFYTVSKMFASVPALFTVLQGSECFSPLLAGLSARDDKGNDDGAFHVATAVRRVVSDLDGLTAEPCPVRDALIADAREVCEKRIKAAIEKAREDNEGIVKGKDEFDEGDIPTYTERATALLEKALKRVERAIKEGAAAFHECAGMQKLLGALERLDLKKTYSLNVKACPPAPPLSPPVPGTPAVNSAKNALTFFGVPEREWSIDLARKLQGEWEIHRSGYVPPPMGTVVSP
jgi:hypothetical protein